MREGVGADGTIEEGHHPDMATPKLASVMVMLQFDDVSEAIRFQAALAEPQIGRVLHRARMPDEAAVEKESVSHVTLPAGEGANVAARIVAQISGAADGTNDPNQSGRRSLFFLYNSPKTSDAYAALAGFVWVILRRFDCTSMAGGIRILELDGPDPAQQPSAVFDYTAPELTAWADTYDSLPPELRKL